MLKIKFLISIGILFLGLLVIGYVIYVIPQNTPNASEDDLSPDYLRSPEISLFEDESISNDTFLYEKNIETMTTPSFQKFTCLGVENCIYGTVTKIIDGDTIKVNNNSVRFALASAPELDDEGGTASKKFIEVLCPVGSEVIVDQDDLQPFDNYDRMVGVIHCNGNNLNEELVESKYGFLSAHFCNSSEFSTQKWAQDHGCPENDNLLKSIYELNPELPNNVD